MKKLTYSVGAIALLTCAMASAQPAQTLNRHVGTYIEGNLGTNLYMLGVVSSNDGRSNTGLNGFAGSVAVGYNTNCWFGFEGGFIRSSVNIDHHEDGQYYQNINAPYASLRFTAPIGERFGLIGKFGIMYATGSDDRHHDHGNDHLGIVMPFVGIGASYAMTPKVDITAQYQGALYAVVNAGVLTGGVTYHF